MSADTGKIGILVLVVGPSGAGKDSLIDGARETLRGDPSVHFVRRAVTRLAAGEDHDTVTSAEFDRAERAGAYLLSWRAHGLAYGIPIEIQMRRREVALVVANVSRTVIDDARRRLQPVHMIAVTAPPAMLAERLTRRGRESAAQLASRIPQAEIDLPDGPDVTRVMNDTSLADGVVAFVAALRAIRAQAI